LRKKTRKKGLRVKHFLGLFIFLCGINELLYFPSNGYSALVYFLGYTGCLLLLYFKRKQLATRGAFLLILVKVITTFPYCANHVFLKLIIATLFVVTDPNSPIQSKNCEQALKWLVPICLFWAGAQKIAYGNFFDGSMLSYLSSIKPSVLNLLSLVLPQEELGNLALIRTGARPFQFITTEGLLVSNLVYVMEIVCAVLLCFRRTQRFGIVLTLILLIGIQLGMREVFFAMYLIVLLLLYLPEIWIRKSIPAFVCACALLILSKFTLLLPFEFHL
jgi:hypothetical protein